MFLHLNPGSATNLEKLLDHYGLIYNLGTQSTAWINIWGAKGTEDENQAYEPHSMA